MRKVMLLFGAAFFFALSTSAMAEDTTGVFMDFYIRGDGSSATKVNRSLVQIPPVEVSYDVDAGTISIVSPVSTEAKVHVYDANGTMVGHTDTLNVTIQLPSSGSYTIYIEGEGWYGIGHID